MSKWFALSIFACGCSSVAGPVPSGSAHVRVAHVPRGPPAVDFCVAAHGTGTWAGPILNGAGRAAGLLYGNATKYFDLDAERYDVRIVAPGSAECTQSLAGLDDFTLLP